MYVKLGRERAKCIYFPPLLPWPVLFSSTRNPHPALLLLSLDLFLLLLSRSSRSFSPPISTTITTDLKIHSQRKESFFMSSLPMQVTWGLTSPLLCSQDSTKYRLFRNRHHKCCNKRHKQAELMTQWLWLLKRWKHSMISFQILQLSKLQLLLTHSHLVLECELNGPDSCVVVVSHLGNRTS